MPPINYRALIREVPDFPKPGILFYDITTLLKDAHALASITDELIAYYQGHRIAKVIGIESRGFIFGGILANRLNAGFVPVRKPGKLPADSATHDPAMIEHILSHRPDREQFEFQMLYGIRRDLQERLRSDGWRVRIYVPCGEAWYPYFMRRLAERPANVWFVAKSLVR